MFLIWGDFELQGATTPSQFGRQISENMGPYMGGVTHGYHMWNLFPAVSMTPLQCLWLRSGT